MAIKSSAWVDRSRESFLCSLRAERNCSPHTIAAYSKDLTKFSHFVGPRLGLKKIDHLLIRDFLAHLYAQGLSKPSVARALASLRSLYKWLAREGIVEQNPAKLVSTPKLPKKLPRVPTIEQMNGLLDSEMTNLTSFP